MIFCPRIRSRVGISGKVLGFGVFILSYSSKAELIHTLTGSGILVAQGGEHSSRASIHLDVSVMQLLDPHSWQAQLLPPILGVARGLGISMLVMKALSTDQMPHNSLSAGPDFRHGS